MDKSTIQILIDKVIGKKGLIRVPSWWMRKVLMQIADWVQEGNDANNEKIVKVSEDAEKLRNLTLPYTLVSGTGEVNIDGNKVSFTDADKQLIYITGAVKFKKGDGSYNDFITYIHIPHIDIRSQGRDMSSMFAYCSGLTSLDLSGFDTSAVTSMSHMFYSCSGLTSLNLSGFDTSAVTSMDSMFAYCSNLTSLNLSGFNTSAVTSMSHMFESCSGLTSLDLSGFNTSAVTSMDSMFESCSGLTSLDLSGFNTSAVTSMDYMFAYCSNLTSLILGPNFLKTSKYDYVNFSYCTKWTNDTVVTSLVTNSYDRATAGLKTMTLKLSTNTKAALTDEQKAAITAKGYTIA